MKELPFFNISDFQLKDLIPKFIMPSCKVLNENFVLEKDDEIENDEFSYTFNKAVYTYSKDIEKLNFDEERESFSSFSIISVNIRSIVNRDNFTKFQALLQTLSIKPIIIALNETWITDLSKGPYSKLKGFKFCTIHSEGEKF